MSDSKIRFLNNNIESGDFANIIVNQALMQKIELNQCRHFSLLSNPVTDWRQAGGGDDVALGGHQHPMERHRHS